MSGKHTWRIARQHGAEKFPVLVARLDRFRTGQKGTDDASGRRCMWTEHGKWIAEATIRQRIRDRRVEARQIHRELIRHR
jgi:hypothetical protein